MSKQAVYYQHTLDGKPAGFQQSRYGAGPYIYFAVPSSPVTLATSLRQIRREQRMAMKSAAELGGNQVEWTKPSHYGYTRVRIPHA